MVAPVLAVEPLALSVMVWPAVGLLGLYVMWATGVLGAAKAADTAALVSSMPAPHVVLVQLHDTYEPDGSVVHDCRPLSAGNALALFRSRAVRLAGLREGLTDSISAAVALTIGAEKLVPISASDALV